MVAGSQHLVDNGKEQDQCLVSVVILNHNGKTILDVLSRSVRSILAQDYPHVQLILVDDNSSDGSEQAVADLAKEAGAIFVSTRDGNHGISAARNAGLRYARGKYIAFLDNDAVPCEGWLSALVARMESDETLGACASRVMFADKPDIVNSLGSVLNELFHGNGVCIHQMYAHACWPSDIMYATGNGMILRRQAVDQVGLFDEGYPFWAGDDADYGMRLWRAGWRIVPEPEAVVLHLHSTSKQLKGMPFWDGRNRIRMALKHQSWWEIPRFILRDVRYFAKPALFAHYVRCWWSTLTHWEGVKGLLAYRWEHRGEPSYSAVFGERFRPPHRLLVVPDNRPYGRQPVPLRTLTAGEHDEPYLYHGWYWPERWASTPMRWGMRVASLICSLPEGARAFHWQLLSRQGAERTSITVEIQRLLDQGQQPIQYETIARERIELPGPPGNQPEEIYMPCLLPSGDYRILLIADEARIEPGFFPRQIGFGLAGLRVETNGSGS